MVIITENVPFSLSIGLDLTYNEDYNYDNALDYINALQQFNIDYIVSPISIKNQELRRNVFKMEKTLNNSELKNPDNISFEKPIFVNDLQMKFFFWKNKFISKIHDIDLEDIPKNFDIITQDLNYANYINSKSSILEIDLEKIFMHEKPNLNGNCTENPKDDQNKLINNVSTGEFNKFRLQYEFYLVKLIKQFFTENIGRHLSIMLEFTKENYYFYTKLQSQINNVDNFEVLLKIDEDLPDEETLKLWCSQNIRALVIPFSLFLFNNHGFPVLSKKHQEYIKHFMRYGIDIILRDDKNFTSLKTLDDMEDYTLYIKHLFVNHFDYKDHHFVLNDYLDVFQIPLQPLKDNLQSQTYECFEDDVAKYDLYEKALYMAFINYKETGQLPIHKVKEFWNTSDVNKKEMKKIDKILNVCLVGAGRGPLMRRIVKAAIDAGLTINPILVEKNKNAFNTLLHLKKTEPHIFSKVKMLFGDMRNLNINYKFDIIVSELLGSFGDNELSPECLADVEKCYLDPNGVMIPHSYSSFVRPVVYPVLWNNVKKLKSNYEFPFLVLFHKAYFPDETLIKVFEFTHPMEKEDPFNMEKSITFTFKDNLIIHGVSGYFDSVLYGDVKMSILPKEKSENMHYSWFPIFFPSLEPIEIRKDDVLQMNIERINNGKRVWYQWNFFKYNNNNTEIKAYPIQNLFGESYTINL